MAHSANLHKEFFDLLDTSYRSKAFRNFVPSEQQQLGKVEHNAELA